MRLSKLSPYKEIISFQKYNASRNVTLGAELKALRAFERNVDRFIGVLNWQSLVRQSGLGIFESFCNWHFRFYQSVRSTTPLRSSFCLSIHCCCILIFLEEKYCVKNAIAIWRDFRFIDFRVDSRLTKITYRFWKGEKKRETFIVKYKTQCCGGTKLK